MKTIEEAKAKVAELEGEIEAERRARADAERAVRAAKEDRRGARKKLRLEVAAKAQRAIAQMQRARAPSEWTDGAVVALSRLHKEIERIPDDGPDEEG